jgi:DNA-binding GntR family transcriptional regulator
MQRPASLVPSADAPAGQGGTATAYQAIRNAIVEGRIRPGERLIEQHLATELSLSRTPVREAVRMLVADGLAVSQRHRGAVVRVMSRADVLDLYELRARLESYGAERAAARHTADDLAAIDGGIVAIDLALARDDVDDLERTRLINVANRQVHGAISQAARHERLVHLLASTVDAPLVFESFRSFSRTQLERSNQFHRMMRDAIVRGEPGRAAALMNEHIMQGRDQVLSGMSGHAQAPGSERLLRASDASLGP